MTRVAVLMDGGPERAETTIDALGHAAAHVGTGLDHDSAGLLDDLGGVVIGPGSPYQRMDPVLEAIRTARERGLPLVGT